MSAEIKYNGNVIASPRAGQKATLKCEGMKMESDVVVEVAEQSGGGGASAPVLAPLTVTENGTYYPTYEAATVTWDETTEYDGTIEVDGVTLRYKKVANLTVPDDVSELENPEYCFAVTFPDGTVQSVPLSDLRLGSADGIYLANDISFAVVWVKDATFVNAGYGASLEDNTVYVTDYLWLAYGEEYAGASLSLTAQGQKIDGFSSVTVDVESTGGSPAINGIIEQYKVNAGATVNAGDFVEFVNKRGSGTFTSGSVSYVSACKLDDTRVLVAYADISNSNYGTAVVLTMEDTGCAVGETVVFSQSNPRHISTTALTGSQALVVYCNNAESDWPAKANALIVDGNAITVGAAVTFCNKWGFPTVATALDDSRALVVWRDYSGSGVGYASIFTVEGTAIEIGTAYQYTPNRSDGMSVCLLTDNTAIVIGLNTSYSAPPGVANALSITGNTITSGSRLDYIATPLAYSAIAPITEQTALVICAYKDGGGGAVVLTANGTTVTTGTVTDMPNIGAERVSVAAIGENKFIVAYREKSSQHGMVTMLTVENGIITVGDSAVFHSDFANYPSLVAFSATSALVLFDKNVGAWQGLTIDGTTVAADTYIGSFVKPATSRLHNVGVAATGGAEGETVDVYVVG